MFDILKKRGCNEFITGIGISSIVILRGLEASNILNFYDEIGAENKLYADIPILIGFLAILKIGFIVEKMFLEEEGSSTQSYVSLGG